MKFVLGIALSLFLTTVAQSQDVQALLQEAHRLEALPKELDAFAKYKEVLKADPVNLLALSKCSELCSRIGQRQINIKFRDDYYAAAKTYAGIAIKINPTHSEANCAMAIALGRSSLSKSGKEKIATAREIKKHVDVAILSDPNNFKAWHVLGRWHYELSNLNLVERTAVKMLYGGLPNATLKESITAFEKAKSLAPGFILNYFEMARSYKKDGQDTKAISYINTMLQLPNQTEDDTSIKQQGKKLLSDWK